MLKLVCFFTALLFLNTDVHGKTDCIQHSSERCEYCVQQPSWSKNCIWCELDNKCHATGSISPFNPCNKKQVIKNAVNCPNQTVLGEYSSQTAYNLLRLSAITYINNRKDAKQCLESQELYDFEIVEWIGRHCEELPLITYKECLAVVMISHDRRAIVLAYRGTKQLKQLIDEVQSVLLTSKSSIGIGSGEVQRYFKQAHDKLYGCVKASIHDQIQNYPEYDILITGHSLGGAIASIASARLVKEGVINTEKIALYTFGMPKVGDRQYAIEHNRLVNNSWRVVHRNDPVPHVPTSIVLLNGLYHHRTEVYYPSEVMLPTDTNYVICSGSVVDVRNDGVQHELWELSSISGDWMEAAIAIASPVTEIHVVASRIINNCDGGVAVDDIEVLNKTCNDTNVFNCHFNNGNKCGYTNSKTDIGYWETHQYITLSNTEWCLKFNGDNFPSGTKAKLTSSILHSSGPRCFRFVYKLCHQNANYLSVLVGYVFNDIKFYGSSLWTRSVGNIDCSVWSKGYVDIPSIALDHVIAIQVERGHQSDSVYIDDVMLQSGNCFK